ncbi:MAG: hypothetical protein LBQ28_04610 [Prevotellaceae bacterium]|jgi:hypothetical protein|nr:hypothetical protein [Prevotellaceae bacterium]
MSEPNKLLYFNDAQLEAMYTGANTEVIIAGRRFGKSHGIAAPRLLRNIHAMPRSAGAFVAATFQQALTRTLPATFAALREMGWVRDVHYVVGHRPSKSMGFAEPIIKPMRYDYVISWYNGAIQHIISQDVKGSSNSLTLDYISIDEAKFIDHEKLKDETLPANGAIKKYFGNCPWHHGLLILSDMPTTKKGSWFFRYREFMDTELIDAIHGLVYEIWRLKQEPKTEHRNRVLCEYNQILSEFRSIATYYREFSTIENIQILGEKYIRQMKRDLSPLVFQTSILCRRITRLLDGFYPSYNEDIHTYTAFNNNYLQSLEYNLSKIAKSDCRQDGDIAPNKPICIAFDYNANINWLVAAQQQGSQMKVIKSFYVKYERKLREIVNDFCEYYIYHPTREVIYYYDNTALGSNYAVNDDDFASVICDQFFKNGWTIQRVHIGNPLKHREKYIMIDQALKGQKYLFPQFNKDNNDALLLALGHTGVVVNSNGFSKDKSGEKLAESEEDKLEYRTDGTDAFDTLLIGMNLYPQQSTQFILGSGIIK